MRQIINEAGIVDPNDGFHTDHKQIRLQREWNMIYAQINNVLEVSYELFTLKPNSDRAPEIQAMLDLHIPGIYTHSLYGRRI